MMHARYRFIGGRRTKLANGRELFTGAFPKQSLIEESMILQAASTCVEPDSLLGHERRLKALCAATPLANQEWLPLLRKAAATHILISDNELQRTVTNCNAEASARLTITRIGIPTRNRPKMLRRALEQLLETQEGHEVCVIVADSSDDDDTRFANRQVVSEIKRTSGVEVQYSSPSSRDRYALALAHQAGVSHFTTSFAIAPTSSTGVTTGSLRNALLLEAAGNVLLYLDDDVQCMTTPVPDADDRFVWGGNKDVFDTWFFPDQTAFRRLPFQRQNLLIPHERALNHLRDANRATDSIEFLSRPLLRHLAKGDSTIIVSSLGVAGDPGIDNPMPFFMSGSKTIQRMCVDDKTFEAAMRTRLILQGPKSTVIARDLGCMSYCMAADARHILPPFCPQYRAAEFVFAALIQAAIPSALFAALPSAVLHSPELARRFEEGAIIKSAGQFTAGEVLVAIIRRYHCPTLPRGDSIRAVGCHLRLLSRLDPYELREFIWDTVAPLIEQWVQILNDTAEHFCALAPKAADELHRASGEALQVLDHKRPFQILGSSSRDGEQQLREFRHLLERFSELLQIWPELWDANNVLRNSGRSLCEK